MIPLAVGVKVYLIDVYLIYFLFRCGVEVVWKE